MTSSLELNLDAALKLMEDARDVDTEHEAIKLLSEAIGIVRALSNAAKGEEEEVSDLEHETLVKDMEQGAKDLESMKSATKR